MRKSQRILRDLDRKTINIRIIGGSLNKGECEETHEIGRRKFFENILELSKSIFFQERALKGGVVTQWTFIDEFKKGGGRDACL